MKNFVQEADRITVPAPYALSSGGGALVGSLFGVALTDAESGADVVLQTTGVVTHAKTSSQAWTVGALIYWDNSNKVLTTAAASGANKLVGVATEAAANPSETGTVRLNGAFIS